MGELIRREAATQPLEFSGERLTAAISGQVEIEHYHRYLLAREYCRGRDVLDCAAGEGYGAALLAQVARSVVGVEIDPASVEAARAEFARPNLSFQQGDARAIPLPDASMDVAVSFETLEHLTEQDLFLSELRRVLRPGGLLMISTPDRDIYSPLGSAPNPFHRLELTRAEFGGGRGIVNEAEVLAMLRPRGFEVVTLAGASLDDQVTLFGAAEAVVGAHGAGLTNIVFLPRNALVVELLHHQYGTTSYSLPSLNAGLRYCYLTCAGHEGDMIPAVPTPPANPTGFIAAPIWVDVDDLARAVDRI